MTLWGGETEGGCSDAERSRSPPVALPVCLFGGTLITALCSWLGQYFYMTRPKMPKKATCVPSTAPWKLQLEVVLTGMSSLLL